MASTSKNLSKLRALLPVCETRHITGIDRTNPIYSMNGHMTPRWNVVIAGSQKLDEVWIEPDLLDLYLDPNRIGPGLRFHKPQTKENAKSPEKKGVIYKFTTPAHADMSKNLFRGMVLITAVNEIWVGRNLRHRVSGFYNGNMIIRTYSPTEERPKGIHV